MTEPVEWIAVVTALGAAVALARWLVVRLRARPVETSLICPKTGAHVDCALLYDDRRGACVDVVSCSAFPAGTTPSCERSCARLINLGLPLEAREREDDPGQG
jgi:hypothetical protein